MHAGSWTVNNACMGVVAPTAEVQVTAESKPCDRCEGKFVGVPCCLPTGHLCGHLANYTALSLMQALYEESQLARADERRKVVREIVQAICEDYDLRHAISWDAREYLVKFIERRFGKREEG